MKKFFIETFGCQMNFSDSEIVASILKDNKYSFVNDKDDANIIFINTCSIRDNAEQRVYKRLLELNSLKKKKSDLVIGVIGCMAERLKDELLEKEKIVDLVAGPDSYRNLPGLLNVIYNDGGKVSDVVLSEFETYDNILPYRIENNHVSAFISVMRGCQKFCTYCVVPFTRGRERSRDHNSILNEARDLVDKGFKEVTLLGQNVNSYFFKQPRIIQNTEHSALNTEHSVPGTEHHALSTMHSAPGTVNFAELLAMVAEISPNLRVRFATSHPRDLSDELIMTIKKYDNICKSIHLPFQSGSSKILKLMNRKYTREDYMNRISAIKSAMPDCTLSTDIIAGFCSETDDDHLQTLSLMEWAAFDYAYMFKYSERPGTIAAKKYPDDVPDDVKTKRLDEIIKLQQKLSLNSNKNDLGKTTEVLIENTSKRSDDFLMGRNSQNKVVIFPSNVSHLQNVKHLTHEAQIGQYVNVKINKFTSATLLGEIV